MICAGLLSHGQAQSAPTDRERAVALCNEAKEVVYNAPDSAIHLLTESRQLSEKLEDPLLLINSMYWMSAALQVKGKFPESTELAESALAECPNITSTHLRDSIETSLRIRLADAQEASGAYDQAYENLLLCLKAAVEQEDAQLMARIYMSLGISSFHREDYRQAITYYKKGLEAYGVHKPHHGHGNTYNLLGAAYAELQMLDSSLYHYELALKHFQEDGNVYLEAVVLCNIASKHTENGAHEQAIDVYRQSVNRFRQIDEHYGLAFSMTNLGLALHTNEEYTLALQHLDSASFYLSNTADPALRAKIYEGYSLVFADLANYEKAYFYQLKREALKDSLNEAEMRANIETSSARFRAEQEALKRSNLEARLSLETANRSVERLLYSIALALLILIVTTWLLIQRHRRTRLQHDLIVSKQNLLLSQLSPHFVFNALNSIQNYVLRGNEINSYAYIGRFGKLMRHFLNSSDHQFVALSEELEAARNYLELEMLRANGGFSYSIASEEGIELEEVQFPSMILQIILENAIWHGVMHLESKGEINIQVTQNTEYHVVRISDNGIGRTRSTEINAAEKPEHVSKGLRLVSEKISLINHSRSKKLQFVIEDGRPQDKSRGTTVSISIPKRQ